MTVTRHTPHLELDTTGTFSDKDIATLSNALAPPIIGVADKTRDLPMNIRIDIEVTGYNHPLIIKLNDTIGSRALEPYQYGLSMVLRNLRIDGFFARTLGYDGSATVSHRFRNVSYTLIAA